MIAMNQTNMKAYNNGIGFKAQESIILGYDAMPQSKSVREIMENIFERREVWYDQKYEDESTTFL